MYWTNIFDGLRTSGAILYHLCGIGSRPFLRDPDLRMLKYLHTICIIYAIPSCAFLS